MYKDFKEGWRARSMGIPRVIKENIISRILTQNSTISYDDIDNNSKVTLKEGYELHEWPDRSLLIYNGIEVLSVNVYGGEIIKSLDGVKSVWDIAKTLSDAKDEFEMKILQIKCFLYGLNRKGILAKNEKARTINITGSKQWFAPYSCSIEITKKCNLKCKHCYGECGIDNREELSYDEIISIIDSLNYKCKSVSITGGDPLCHKNIKDILNYCSNKNLEVTLITNGMSLDEEFIKYLKKTNVCKVKLSLDGHNDEMHDSLRGKNGAFKKVIYDIKLLKKAGIKVSIGCVITDSNIEYLENIAEVAYINGADSIGFGNIIGKGRAINNSEILPKNEMEYILEKVDKVMRIYRDMDFLVTYGDNGNWIDFFQKKCPSISEYCNYKDYNNKVSCNNCGAGSRLLFIEANGNVKPCMMSDFNIGNIRENGSVANIMNNNPIANIFRNLEYPDISECEGCENIFECFGCIAQGIINSKVSNKCIWKAPKQINKLNSLV